MVKYSQGTKMKQACEEVGIDPRTVKKWETTPEVKKFYSSLIKDAFVEGKNKLFKAWPKVAERLIKTATDHGREVDQETKPQKLLSDT